MARIHRGTPTTLIATLVAAFIAAQSTTTLLASDSEHPTDARPSIQAPQTTLTYDGKPLAALQSRSPARPIALTGSLVAAPMESSAFGQWGGGFRHRRGRNAGAATAIFLGAAGAIAGAALLVYAERPECNTNPALGGCGYGTKVIGGAVLSAGLVGLMVGALTWR